MLTTTQLTGTARIEKLAWFFQNLRRCYRSLLLAGRFTPQWHEQNCALLLCRVRPRPSLHPGHSSQIAGMQALLRLLLSELQFTIAKKVAITVSRNATNYLAQPRYLLAQPQQ